MSTSMEIFSNYMTINMYFIRDFVSVHIVLITTNYYVNFAIFLNMLCQSLFDINKVLL